METITDFNNIPTVRLDFLYREEYYQPTPNSLWTVKYYFKVDNDFPEFTYPVCVRPKFDDHPELTEKLKKNNHITPWAIKSSAQIASNRAPIWQSATLASFVDQKPIILYVG
jgi:hypothetical protein